jgi:hypothetical protein
MDWKNLSWPALAALAFLVIMFVTLVIPNLPAIVTSAFGSAAVVAAILSLRDR